MSCVLVIDDDDLVREVVEAALASQGHEVILALDGRDGVEQFKKRRFDLVVCDVFMPNHDGIETLRDLRTINPDLPILMMTGGAAVTHANGGEPADADFLRMSRLLGATSTIAKPFRLEELLDLVQRCLESGAAADGQ